MAVMNIKLLNSQFFEWKWLFVHYWEHIDWMRDVGSDGGVDFGWLWHLIFASYISHMKGMCCRVALENIFTDRWKKQFSSHGRNKHDLYTAIDSNNMCNCWRITESSSSAASTWTAETSRPLLMCSWFRLKVHRVVNSKRSSTQEKQAPVVLVSDIQ